MTYDKTTFLSGLTMGLCGKGNPTFEGSGKYLYNGMKFPKLPERDKSTYPYAVITYGNLIPQFENNVSLYFLKEIRYSERGGLYVYNGLKTASTAYSDDFVWSELQESVSGSAVAFQWLHWANTDILNVNGSVYLAASDPVPVEDTFTKGYHVGAELRRKRVLPEKEPVAYLYNGVRLPPLPEWDKEAYPYTAIYVNSWATYSCILSPEPLYLEDVKIGSDYSTFLYNLKGLPVFRVKVGDASWVDGGTYSVDAQVIDDNDYVVWSNHSILHAESGALYVTASEPIPVYE